MKRLGNQTLWALLLPLTLLSAASPALAADGICTYFLGPNAGFFSAEGGTSSTAITTDDACPWSVVNPNEWITINSYPEGVGNGSVIFTVAPNQSLSPRTGVFSIEGETFTVSQAESPCTIALEPTSRIHDFPAEFATFNVIAPDGCPWTVDTATDWLIIKLYTNGTGNGVVRYAVVDNPNPFARTGSFSVNGVGFTVTQLPGPCVYSIMPTNALFGAGAASGNATVFTPDTCQWSVSNTNGWITITSATNGSGGGVVNYLVAPSYISADRRGIITIAGQPLVVTQLGTSCRYSVSPTNRTHSFGVVTGAVTMTTSVACPWSVVTTNGWIILASGTNRIANGTVPYTLSANPTSLARTGSLSMANQIVTLIQTGTPCICVLAPASRTHAFLGDVGIIGVAAPVGCNWSVQNTNDWIAVTSGPGGISNGVVTYQVAVNSGRARTGRLAIGNSRFTITQAEALPATITTAPSSRNAVAGTTVTFTAAAAGAAPLSYQWQLNGVNLADRIGVSGAQTPTLTLFGVQWWQAGNYSFVASNLRGPVTSSPAVLTVNTTPIWTNPGDKTISRGAPLLFTASAFDVDTPPQTLTYSLVSGAPSGASLDPATGLFTWAGAQSSSTNRVALRVTDNGSPSLSATQTININVVAGFLTNTTLVATGSLWRYRDTGEDLGLPWTAPAFNDSAWKAGAAKLGYGSGNESTIVSYGPNSGSKYITTYFRRAFTVTSPSTISALSLRVMRDDGIVVYLNGTELYRDNMPPGPINYRTIAASSVSSSARTTYYSSPQFPPGALLPGENVVAAEVHQRSASSSGMLFDLELTASQNFFSPEVVVQPRSQSVPEGGSASLSVTVLGALPLRHQWYFQGAALLDATNSTLSLANVPPSQGGAYSVVVTNQLGSTISAVATLTVIPNSPPVLAPIGDRTASESTPLSFTAIATDPDSPGQVLTYSLDAGAPNGASINPATGLFSWIPSEGQGPSLNLVTIRVTDNGTPPLSDFETINITVQELTTLPVLTPIGNKTVTEGSLLTFTAGASDADVPAQTLKFTLDAGAPLGAAIGPASGVFTWTPSETQGPGTYLVTIRVTDSGVPPSSAFETITITVRELNTAPVMGPLGNRAVVQGSVLTFTASATDADFPAQVLTYSLGPGASPGASINPTTGVFTYAPATNAPAPSTNSFTIRVTDNGSPALSDAKQFMVTVIAGFSTNLSFVPVGSFWKYRDTGEDLGTGWTALAFNDGLWKSGPAMLGYSGGGEATVVNFGPNSSAKYITTYFRRAFSVANPSGLSPLNLRVRRDDGVVVYLNGAEVYRDNMPTGPINYLTPAPLSVSGTDKTDYHVANPISPTYLVPGLNVLSVEIHQHSASSTSMDFDLELTATLIKANNSPPVLAPIADKTVASGNLLSFGAAAADADLPAQTLTYSLDNGAPAGASINPTTGLFTWTPSDAQGPSTNIITLRVTDNGSPPLSDVQNVSVAVSNTGGISLVVGNTNGVAGDQITVPVRATRFNNIISFQFSLHWDATAAAFVTVEQIGLTGLNFGMTQTNQGILTVSWDDTGAISQTLTNGQILFAPRLQLLGTSGTISDIWIDSTPTIMEAANGDLEIVPVMAAPGRLTNELSNPSPAAPLVSTATTPPRIAISLDSAGTATVKWNAAPGKTYRVQYTSDPFGNDWIDLGREALVPDSIGFARDAPQALRQRFYRVMLLE